MKELAVRACLAAALFLAMCPGECSAKEKGAVKVEETFTGAAKIWGRGPRGEETCPEGKCQKYAKAELRACTGLCREYYPQIRKFLKDTLPKYNNVFEIGDGQGGMSPTMYFFNARGVQIEKLEVNGMYDHEMVEELEKRGIFPASSTKKIGSS